MRLTTVTMITAAGLAVSLLVGGAYHHFASISPGELADRIRVASPTAARLETASPFSMHDNPQPVPDLQFVDGEGRETTLGSFVHRTVLLNVWATWCVPCREEMPALDRLQARLGGPDFEVVPLSIDRGGLPTIETFYQELGLTALPIYVDESGSAAQQLDAIGIPTTLLINNDGEEVGRLVGPAEWDSPEIIALLQRHIQPTTAARAEQRPSIQKQENAG